MKFWIHVTITGVGTYSYGADSEAAARILANLVRLSNHEQRATRVVIENANGKTLVEFA